MIKEIYQEDDSDEVKKASSRSYMENLLVGQFVNLFTIGNVNGLAYIKEKNKILVDQWDYMEYYRVVFKSIDDVLKQYPIISRLQEI